MTLTEKMFPMVTTASELNNSNILSLLVLTIQRHCMPCFIYNNQYVNQRSSLKRTQMQNTFENR